MNAAVSAQIAKRPLAGVACMACGGAIFALLAAIAILPNRLRKGAAIAKAYQNDALRHRRSREGKRNSTGTCPKTDPKSASGTFR